MNTVNTNISALIAQKNMQEQNRDMDAAMQRLSSGLRIRFSKKWKIKNKY